MTGATLNCLIVLNIFITLPTLGNERKVSSPVIPLPQAAAHNPTQRSRSNNFVMRFYR